MSYPKKQHSEEIVMENLQENRYIKHTQKDYPMTLKIIFCNLRKKMIKI